MNVASNSVVAEICGSRLVVERMKVASWGKTKRMEGSSQRLTESSVSEGMSKTRRRRAVCEKIAKTFPKEKRGEEEGKEEEDGVGTTTRERCGAAVDGRRSWH